jgi:hypothetical protein
VDDDLTTHYRADKDDNMPHLNSPRCFCEPRPIPIWHPKLIEAIKGLQGAPDGQEYIWLHGAGQPEVGV